MVKHCSSPTYPSATVSTTHLTSSICDMADDTTTKHPSTVIPAACQTKGCKPTCLSSICDNLLLLLWLL